ncbi:hypothetical protein D9611_008331 [Ephemerocybe angulata]|uniref:Dolichyl-phosphate-mannose--protein mannosyltransferase n=1 Tax=Ephemerocybe angulata TaxID=980116 RepID=A0A8H5BIS4_9AGAR|nr:hypothetical protein D9611_008331 [Tulosesus angulatus]
MPPPTTITEFLLQNTEVIVPVVYTFLCRTRFHRIGASNTVVWDEVHFGKLRSHHLMREFYFDVHPPLGKMLVGLAGLLSGYGGRFEFKSGEVYSDMVPYVAMRVMLATFGVLMVPLAWFTSVELGMAQWACRWFCLLCSSRFILLDSVLLLFAFLTVFRLTQFHNELFEQFSIDWWVWLFFTGISIGCVTINRDRPSPCSVKMIGLFATALVGVYTLEDLWDKFGDTRLIMSHPFQAHDFYKNPLDVAFGSRVTLKNMDWGGGLLHSHETTTRGTSSPHGTTSSTSPKALSRLRYLKDGDTIHLSHVSTGRNNLRSHTVTAPVSKLNYEMSGYWNLTVEDNHDYWQVEIVDDTKRGSVVKHLALGCYLHAANAVLPQWGFKQIEVSCDEENNKKDAHTYWNVEIPAGNMKLYKSPFLRDFWTSNNALIPDPDKKDMSLDLEAVRLAFPPSRHEDVWVGDNQIKYYLMGTPVVWWGSTISLGVALLTFTVYILRWQRKYNDLCSASSWNGGEKNERGSGCVLVA